MNSFLIKKRYYLFNYSKLFKNNTFGFFILTQDSLELQKFLENKNIFNIRITNSLINFLFHKKYNFLFTSLFFFVVFENSEIFFQILTNLQKYFKKNNFNYQIFFLKINDYFINFNLYLKLKKIKEYNNFIIFYLFYYIFLFLNILLKNIFYIYPILLFNLKK